MGKIMLNGKQYGVGGITDAEDVKYGNTTVDAALDQNASDISANTTEINTLKNGLSALRYRVAWGTSLTVNHTAANQLWLVALNAAEVYIVANQSGGLNSNQIFGTASTLTFTRNSATQFVITKPTNGSIYALAI